MLVNLVVLSSLLLPVKTDWVEISQQHYRKPFRPIQAKGKVQVTTETVNIYGGNNNRIYANQSVNQDWDDNGDPQVASSSIGSVKHVRRPGVKIRRTGRPTGNVIKHGPQHINEKDEQNEKRIDFYDYDVRHDDSQFGYEIPGKDQIANKRRPINEHNLNDRFKNIDKYQQRLDSERHENKVVRLKENPIPTVVPRRTNRFEEDEIRKNEAHKLNNVRSTTLAPRNISKIKDITNSNNKRMDMKNPEEEVNFNNQNQFKTAGHMSGGNRRRIYFFDPPKTDEHEDRHEQSGSMKNPKESINVRNKPIASTDTSKPHVDTEKETSVRTPKPNRNIKPSDFNIVLKPESAELFSPSANKAVKLLEETPATESYDQQHKNMNTYKSDRLNEDSILIDSPLIQTADDKNPFVTNHYHNINHGNIRRIEFFGNKKAEEDIVEFNENVNKSPESSNNVNKNMKPDKLISGTINKGNGKPVNLNDKFEFIDDKITQSQKQVHIKQPFITGTIQRVQFPENNHGGKQYQTSATGAKYPDDQDLPMEHKQINNNGERTPEHPSKFASGRPPLVQNSNDDGLDDDSDIQTTPIRRLDIASLTSANIPEFITKQEPPDAHEIYKVFIETESTTQKIYTRRLTTVAVKVEESTPNWVDGEVKPSTDKITEHPTDKVPNDNSGEEPYENSEDEKVKNPNPLENVAKFMKVVSETLSKNTQRSIKGKVRYLEQLRDSILTNIEEHIESVWPDDAPRPRGARGARGARAARGHVDFPSSEGALMTISFLTFAVFLIKLVLQVIHTYKNKTMMVTPAVYAVSRMAGALKRPPDNSDN